MCVRALLTLDRYFAIVSLLLHCIKWIMYILYILYRNKINSSRTADDIQHILFLLNIQTFIRTHTHVPGTRNSGEFCMCAFVCVLSMAKTLYIMIIVWTRVMVWCVRKYIIKLKVTVNEIIYSEQEQNKPTKTTTATATTTTAKSVWHATKMERRGESERGRRCKWRR